MKTTIKILHVVHSLGIGGLENGLVNLVTRLDADEFNHTVCCLTTAGEMAERLRDSSVSIMELGLSPEGFRFPMVRLVHVLRQTAPDILHTRGWPAVDAVFAGWFANIPRIVHGEHGREYSDTEGKNWKRNQVRRIVGQIVDRYVIVSDFFRSWLRTSCRVKNDRITHIPNGVDTEKFRPPSDGPDPADAMRASRDRLGLPSDRLLLGTVGRLDPVKDFDTLLRAFREITTSFPDVHLVVIGDGPLRPQLTATANALGLAPYISWFGARKDIPELLRCLDVFVQTSVFEGMSNTILEAMSTGLPIVATNAGGNSELVRPANGALLSVRDVNGLAVAISRYLGDRAMRQTHGRESRTRAMTQFGLSLMASRYAAMYQALGSNL